MSDPMSHSWLGAGSGRNAGRKQNGRFEDLLDERRRRGDVAWITRRFEPPSYRFLNNVKTPVQIVDTVLGSDRVRYGIQRLSEELERSQGDLMVEAHAILTEMAHNLSMSTIRTTGFLLAKVMKQIYRSVYVNREGIEQLRAAAKEYPVVLLPSHRSYADFLLLSFLCYDYDLPMPVIAAAMDFLNMNFFGKMLRNCGAFFIRRSFTSDKLYWLLFTEYVKLHVREGQHMVEFFLEGTRSRTAKSLQPKTGMLGSILESWFVGEVPDIYLVPINISHDRILEESLYAYELLGIPKPKESASGLLKARHILSEDFGDVHVYFDKPISLRQLAQGHIDRSKHNLQCRLSMGLFPEELDFIRRVSREMVAKQQHHAVLAPWCLYATILLMNPRGLQAGELTSEGDWLRRVLVNMGAFISWPVGKNALEVLWDQVQLHANLVAITRSQHPVLSKVRSLSDSLQTDDLIRPLFCQQLDSVPASNSAGPPSTEPKSDLLAGAALGLQLSSYRNQLIHLAVQEAFVCSLINSACLTQTQELHEDSLKADYIKLEQLFSKEFVYASASSEENLRSAVRNLSQLGGIQVIRKSDQSPAIIDLTKSQTRHTVFLGRLIEPFLLGYWLVTGHAVQQHRGQLSSNPLNNSAPLLSDRDIAKRVQTVGFALVGQDPRFRYEIGVLSLDLLTNAVHSLRKLGLLQPHNGGQSMNIGNDDLSSMHTLLSNILGDNVNFIPMEKYWKFEKVPAAKI